MIKEKKHTHKSCQFFVFVFFSIFLVEDTEKQKCGARPCWLRPGDRRVLVSLMRVAGSVELFTYQRIGPHICLSRPSHHQHDLCQHYCVWRGGGERGVGCIVVAASSCLLLLVLHVGGAREAGSVEHGGWKTMETNSRELFVNLARQYGGIRI